MQTVSSHADLIRREYEAYKRILHRNLYLIDRADTQNSESILREEKTNLLHVEGSPCNSDSPDLPHLRSVSSFVIQLGRDGEAGRQATARRGRAE